MAHPITAPVDPEYRYSSLTTITARPRLNCDSSDWLMGMIGPYPLAAQSWASKHHTNHSSDELPSVRLTNLVSLIKVVFVLMETYITVLAPGLGFT